MASSNILSIDISNLSLVHRYSSGDKRLPRLIESAELIQYVGAGSGRRFECFYSECLLSQRVLFEDVPNGQLHSKAICNSRKQLYSQQRVAAEIEEIVVPPDTFNA